MQTPRIRLDPSMIPSSESTTLTDSSYFAQAGALSLPSPDEVRLITFDSKPDGSTHTVTFPALNLLVKYGKRVTVGEGQTLWAIWHLVNARLGQERVPVPEVYGWCVDGDEVFVYMELVQGVTLEDRWSDLSSEERDAVCAQLRNAMTALRQPEQSPGDRFIGDIVRRPINDDKLSATRLPVLPNVSAFWAYCEEHADPWIKFATQPQQMDDSDLQSIVFTHANLHPRNIIVPSEGPARVLALVDWRQAGWYPACWERANLCWAAETDGDSCIGYFDRVLDMSVGCVRERPQ